MPFDFVVVYNGNAHQGQSMLSTIALIDIAKN